MDDYLKAIEDMDLTPNFWMSAEYIRFAGLRAWEDDGWWGLVDPDRSEWFFPPVLEMSGYLEEHMGAQYYCGLPREFPPPGGRKLDVQYIYHPEDFQNISGSRWHPFRKSLKHIRGTFKPHELEDAQHYRRLTNADNPQVEKILASWSSGREIQDNETFIKFCLFGRRRWGLFRSDQMVGFNVADLNWHFINYRVCVDNGEPYAQEYLRYMFYTSHWVRGIGLPVNDGGNLGSEGLDRFKRKLQPRTILNVFTTLPETGDQDGDQQESCAGSA